ASADGDVDNIDRVDFYVNGIFKYGTGVYDIENLLFKWQWDEFGLGKYTLKTEVFDYAKNSATCEIIVWNFF
ncbi:unnamed protein product, partial [marine sediment metagenome]